jgi:hypothetical protein
MDLDKLTPAQIITYLLIVTATICAGSLAILIFDTDLFFQLSDLKLILIAASITLPFLIINIGLFYFSNLIRNTEAKIDLFSIGTGAFWSIVLINSSILELLKYKKTGIIDFVIFCLLGELIITCVWLLKSTIERFFKRKGNKKLNNRSAKQ